MGQEQLASDLRKFQELQQYVEIIRARQRRDEINSHQRFPRRQLPIETQQIVGNGHSGHRE